MAKVVISDREKISRSYERFRHQIEKAIIKAFKENNTNVYYFPFGYHYIGSNDTYNKQKFGTCYCVKVLEKGLVFYMAWSNTPTRMQPTSIIFLDEEIEKTIEDGDLTEESVESIDLDYIEDIYTYILERIR